MLGLKQLRVQVLGNLGFRVWGLGFGFLGLGFRASMNVPQDWAEGFGLGVHPPSTRNLFVGTCTINSFERRQVYSIRLQTLNPKP